MDQSPAPKRPSALVLLTAAGALMIGIGAFPHWGFAKSSLADGLSWPITGEAFPHGYLFLGLSAIGLALTLLQAKGLTNAAALWRFSILAAVVVLGDALWFLLDVDFNFEFAGPGIFVTSLGAITFLTGATLARRLDSA